MKEKTHLRYGGQVGGVGSEGRFKRPKPVNKETKPNWLCNASHMLLQLSCTGLFEKHVIIFQKNYIKL